MDANVRRDIQTPPPYEQLLDIRALKSQLLEEGDIWYLISKLWYERWENACMGRISKDSVALEAPGPVDNSDITQCAPYPGKNYDLILMPPVIEGERAEFLPKLAFDKLVRWCGPAKYPYEYTVTSVNRKMHIEMYPRRLCIYPIQSSGPVPPIYITISRHLPLSSLIQQFDFQPNMDLIRVDLDRTLRPWGETHPMTIEDFCLLDGEKHLVLGPSRTAEQEDESVDDAFLALCDSLVAVDPMIVADSARKLAASADGKPRRAPLVTGTRGLFNLGETCYMNSALQCICRVRELTNYFINDTYLSELNSDNPLGTGEGVLARAYADLIKNLFARSSYIAYAPRRFKRSICLHAPQFAEYAQQDSQELLAFFLDGLHEDLNRISTKPYVPNPEWCGGGNKELLELAMRSWDAYKKRNDSVIVDLFQGQYKSAVICAECQHTSVIFDPFMYLTLPIPIQVSWDHQVFYVPWNYSESGLSARIVLPRDASIRLMKDQIATRFGTSPARLFAAEVWQGRWHKAFSDDDYVAEIKPEDKIIVYEFPDQLSPTDPTACLAIPVFHTFYQVPEVPSQQRPTNIGGRTFGIPTFIFVTTDEPVSQEALQAAILSSCSRWSPSPLGSSPPNTASSGFTSPTDHPLCTITLRVGRSDERYTAPSPIAIEYGTSQPTPWRTRRADTETTSFAGTTVKDTIVNDNGFDRLVPLHLHALDMLVVEWNPQSSIYPFGAGNIYSLFQDHVSRADDKHTLEVGNERAPRNTDNDGITLQDCLSEFTREELLGCDSWYCSRCREHRPARKTLEIWKVPDVLVVQLKRFNNYGAVREKNCMLVDFPVYDLDMSAWAGEQKLCTALRGASRSIQDTELDRMASTALMYDLFAVSEHEGTSLGDGHYRAYALNQEDNQWYHYADARVAPARAEDAVNRHAYMLFYRRREHEQPRGR